MSITRRELRGRLQAAGTRIAPSPRPEFVAGLEKKVLAQAAPRRPTALAPLIATRRRPRILPIMSAAAAIAAAVVLTGALAGWFGRGAPHHPLALAVAVDTVVVMPDGTSMQGVNGLELPDGTVVRTGPNGHVSAGTVDLGPGLEGIVEAGRLVLRQPPTTLPPAVRLPSTTLPAPRLP